MLTTVFVGEWCEFSLQHSFKNLEAQIVNKKISSWNSSSFVNFIVKVINFISGSFFYSNQKFSYQVFKKWDAMMKSITLYAKLKINFKNMRNNHKT